VIIGGIYILLLTKMPIDPMFVGLEFLNNLIPRDQMKTRKIPYEKIIHKDIQI